MYKNIRIYISKMYNFRLIHKPVLLICILFIFLNFDGNYLATAYYRLNYKGYNHALSYKMDTKKKKKYRKYRKGSVVPLDTKIKKFCVEDSKSSDAEAVISLVNMSSEDIPEQNTSKISRIRFNDSLSKQNQSSVFSKRSSVDKETVSSAPSISFKDSEDIFDPLDPTSCYHPQCSFAYNLTGNVRRDSLITECLPFKTYQRLAELWGLNPLKTPRLFGNTCRMQNVEEEDEEVEEYIRNVEKDLGIRSDVSEDLQINIGSFRGSDYGQKRTELKDNPYLKFFKSDGDVNDEQKNKTSLRKKATRITKKIIKNFLDWYESLGGNDGETVIDEFTLQELFQIGFEFPAAKAMIIKVKEMPTVPDALAALNNEPKHATSYGLKQFLKQDIIKENIPPKMFAFGRMLPKGKPSLRYKPPNNAIQKTWMECSRVPKKLDTMEAIWAGLEGLRSTVAFSTWLKDHPEITPPTYLQEKGLLDINYEDWNQMYKGFEVEVDNVEAASSETKQGFEVKGSKSQLEESKTTLSASKNSYSDTSF